MPTDLRRHVCLDVCGAFVLHLESKHADAEPSAWHPIHLNIFTQPIPVPGAMLTRFA